MKYMNEFITVKERWNVRKKQELIEQCDYKNTKSVIIKAK